MMPATLSKRGRIVDLLKRCDGDHDLFNTGILGPTYIDSDGYETPSDYWSRQVEICESVRRYSETLAPSGNGVGKSFTARGLILSFLFFHPNCKVVITAPSQTQLEEVLWKQVEAAYTGSRIPLGGRLLKNPLKVDLGGEWCALAYSTTKTERLSGHHRGDLLTVVDEASGVTPEIFEALDSCNPSRSLLLGNPLRPDGTFYERCMRAESQAEEPDRLANLIRISSLESPDIHLERSPRGLADATWLKKSRNDYGENSIWWLPHVLAQFPGSAVGSLFDKTWLDLAALTIHKHAGPKRMSIDLAEGGGDPAGILVRDDNGIHYCEINPKWGLEETAKEAAKHAQHFNVQPSRITFDAGGIGADFGNRLQAEGLHGCMAYKGGNAGGKGFMNLRSASAWLLRQRLDPNRKDTLPNGVMVPQSPFAIPAQMMQKARRELQACMYELMGDRRIILRPTKDDMCKALGYSPTHLDLLLMSFSFPSM